MFDAVNFIKTLPENPGVYKMFDKHNNLLYVGKAKNLKRRISSYFKTNLINKNHRISLMVKQINKIEISLTHTENEALLLESNLIKTLSPKYNIVFRDDKSYLYIILSNDTFAKLGYFRSQFNANNYKQKNIVKNNIFFGPFPSTKAVFETINLLQKTFLLRTCENSQFTNRQRPCLLYSVGRCSAPCIANKISLNDYQNNIKKAILFLKGEHQKLIDDLILEMKSNADNLNFEKATELRNQIRRLYSLQETQFIHLLKNNKNNTFVSNLNVDIITLIVFNNNENICLNHTIIRAGKYLGDNPIFPQNTTNIHKNNIVKIIIQFLLQTYFNNNFNTINLPNKFLFNIIIDNKNESSNLLTEQRLNFIHKQLFSTRNNIIFLNNKALAEEYLQWKKLAEDNAIIAIENKINKTELQKQKINLLQKILAIKINHIECFDISHLRGEKTIASCVVYKDYKLQKNLHQKFNLTNINNGDDYAAIFEAIQLRYKDNTTENLPQLILIDGGFGQLKSAITSFNFLCKNSINKPIFLGIAKGENRKLGKEKIIKENGEVIPFKVDNIAFNLLLNIRDEAHYFAISNHRKLRDKSRQNFTLENIKGIGKQKRQALLIRFGNIQNIKVATLEQLTSVKGISVELANNIINFFKANS